VSGSIDCSAIVGNLMRLILINLSVFVQLLLLANIARWVLH
jgi:hypothetical protein